jgi:hypothetical protein
MSKIVSFVAYFFIFYRSKTITVFLICFMRIFEMINFGVTFISAYVLSISSIIYIFIPKIVTRIHERRKIILYLVDLLNGVVIL